MPTSIPQLPITTCPTGVGSLNTNPGSANLPPLPAYVPPTDQCIGQWRLTDPACVKSESIYHENLLAEQLEISGADVNVFKLLGVHEQGKLIDLTGQGEAISSSGDPQNAFDSLATAWVSEEIGSDVTSTPAYLGYDFGIRLTSFGQPENAPGVAAARHITKIKLTQSAVATSRVRQLRVDRSNGDYRIDPTKIEFTGTGNGTLGQFIPGYDTKAGLTVLFGKVARLGVPISSINTFVALWTTTV